MINFCLRKYFVIFIRLRKFMKMIVFLRVGRVMFVGFVFIGIFVIWIGIGRIWNEV